MSYINQCTSCTAPAVGWLLHLIYIIIINNNNNINNNSNKKYVLWNAGICPIASKVGHVTLVLSLIHI